MFCIFACVFLICLCFVCYIFSFLILMPHTVSSCNFSFLYCRTLFCLSIFPQYFSNSVLFHNLKFLYIREIYIHTYIYIAWRLVCVAVPLIIQWRCCASVGFRWVGHRGHLNLSAAVITCKARCLDILLASLNFFWALRASMGKLSEPASHQLPTFSQPCSRPISSLPFCCSHH